MLIAHIPAGYITAKALGQEKKSVIASSMFFSVWPDLGLIYFYFFDSRNTFHRHHFPHLPIVMAITFLITLPLYRAKFFEKARIYYVLFFLNWLIHFVLDTFTEHIFWLYPFSNAGFRLIEIPANFNHWIISFVLHWSFAVEAAIVTVAVVLFVKARKQRQKKGTCPHSHSSMRMQ